MAKEFPAKIRIGAIDKVSQVLDKVTAKFPKMERSVRRTSTAFKIFQQQTEGVRDTLNKIGGTMKSVGQMATFGMTLPVIAAAGFSVKAFADYETALIGVGKTTNTSGLELEEMGQRFRDMSKEIPIPVGELLKLGQTAAQLGVTGSDNIVNFAAVLGKLSKTTDIVGEEGATSLARLIGVTKGNIGEVENFASALVGLGNTSKATESEILHFATRLGGSTALYGVSGVQALAMATALKSVGIEAEAGSSSVQRAMGKMNEAISGGGKKAQALSAVTGIAMSDLKERFKTDAVGTLREFAAGLARVEKNGGDVTQALKFFGLAGVRDIQTMGSLIKNVDLLDEKLVMASKSFKENTALQQEFNAASKTLDNRWIDFKNTVGDLAITLGAKFKPALTLVLDALIAAAEFLNQNPWALNLAMALAAAAAAIGPVLIGLGGFLTILPSMITGFQLLQALMVGFGITSWAALAPLLILIAKFVLITAVIVGLGVLLYKFRNIIIATLVNVWDMVLTKLDFVMKKLSPVGDLFRKIFGGDSKMEVKTSGQAQGAPLSPQGAPMGGLEASEKINREFIKQTNNARVDINVRAPKSTTIVGDSQNGMMNINRGLAGAF